MTTIRRVNGVAEWTHEKGDKYLITGKDRDGRRFRRVVGTWFYAEAINIWQGSKWLLRKGKRYLIQRVTN